MPPNKKGPNMLRKNWRTIILVFLMVFLTDRVIWAMDSTPTKSQRAALTGLKAVSQDVVKVRWSSKGAPAFLTGKFTVDAAAGKTKAQLALNFLQQHKNLFRINNAAAEFAVKKVENDDIGFEHVRLSQQYQGIPVYGGDLIVHFNSKGEITAVNGNYLPDIKLVTVSAKISAADSIEIARKKLKVTKTDYRAAPVVNLKVYPFKGTYFLIWHAVLPVGSAKLGDWEYFIDANSGKVLHKFNGLKFQAATGSGKGVLGDTRTLNTYNNGGTYYLYDTTKPMFASSAFCSDTGVINTFDLQATIPASCPNTLSADTDNNWIDNTDVSCGGYGGTNNQNAEVDGHFYAGVTYDYFYYVHNRNSFDNWGSSINVFVHYNTCYNNAFWDSYAYSFNFGDGDGTTFAPFSGALDVVAHEFTHGITDYTANLIYQYQSGALNESYSDVFGAFAEFYHEGISGDWLMGDDIYTPSYAGDGLRDMMDPALNGLYNRCNVFSGGQPGHMNEYAIIDNPLFWDGGGVHINSGIPNRAAYLVAKAIGRTAAEKIYFRALTVYLTSTSGFVDARDATLQACSDLYPGDNGKYTAIEDAFDMVGILGAPTGKYYSESQIPNEFIGAGTAKGWSGDEKMWSYTLPFTFPFFGKEYTELWVTDNGFLTFVCHYGNASYTNNEERLKSIPMIAALWDDLVTNQVYIHQPTLDSVCFRWVAVPYGLENPINIEIILYKDGRIKFNYGPGNSGIFPTVGISTGNLVDYDIGAYNGYNSLPNAESILYTPCVTPANPANPAPQDGETVAPVDTMLNWNDAPDTESYNVYFGTQNPPAMVICADTALSSCNPGALNINTTYYWQVVSNNQCFSAAGPVWSFTTESCVHIPRTPGNPSPADQAADISLNSALNWDDAGYAESYRVYFGATSPAPYVGQALTSAYDAGVYSEGATYYWRIAAENTACGSVSGPEWSFSTCVITTYYRDADSDGYGDSAVYTVTCPAQAGYVTDNTDCDDTRANVNPGAPEACDELDNDCNGIIDEGVQNTYYRDADGDGYGDSLIYTKACLPPTGYVLDNTDCDDTRINVNPGAAELCDELDNNCNGQVDEGVKNTFYRDTDGDGYGDSLIFTQSCSAPAGYAADGTDCNDADPSINPGAAELCDNKDNNCNGQVD